METKVLESTYSWVFGDCALSVFVSVTQVITFQRYLSISKLVMLSFFAYYNSYKHLNQLLSHQSLQKSHCFSSASLYELSNIF